MLAPRVLEIGIGDGEKISEDAKNQDHINFIGCDIFADGVLRAMKILSIIILITYLSFI